MRDWTIYVLKDVPLDQALKRLFGERQWLGASKCLHSTEEECPLCLPLKSPVLHPERTSDKTLRRRPERPKPQQEELLAPEHLRMD